MIYFNILTFAAVAGSLGSLSYEINGQTVTITDCDTAAINVVVPDQIEGFSVTSIGNGAFFGCSSLTSIKLPESLVSIGSGAFVACGQWNGIESMIIPKGVSSIGTGVFHGCRVSSLIVEKGNQHYVSTGDVLFNEDKTELIACLRGKSRSYAIPDSVIKIGDSAFIGCYSLTNIILPAGVTNIGRSAFSNCSNLTTLTIPWTVTGVEKMAFSRCGALASIEVEEGNSNLSSLDGVLFNADQTELIACPKTRSGTYVAPNGVVKLGEFAFSDCQSLANIILPDGLRDVGTYAFASCYSLETITFPRSVRRIDDDAFSCCRKLQSVTFLGDAPEAFGLTVFSGASSEFRIHRYKDSSGFDAPRWKGHAFVVKENINPLLSVE